MKEGVERKNKKVVADMFVFDFDPKFEKMKIGFGETFYYHEKKIWLSETPLQGPTLVSIENIFFCKKRI
jgi:hypothetical protein